tara:strand:+ start:108 stop:476 length:369 start_codon:yes stop_codon:yes gene_type:complete
MPTINLGLVKGVFPQTTPPSRTDVLWIDTSLSPQAGKFYNGVTSAWEGFINATPITLTGDTLTRPEFVGLTIEQIKTAFRLMVDGEDIITKDATTLASIVTGTIDFGFDYSGAAYLVKYANV